MSPARISISIKGDKELSAGLGKLPEHTRRKIIGPEFNLETKLLRRAILPHVPYLEDPSTLGSGSQGRTPGQLRNAIVVTVSKSRPGFVGASITVSNRTGLGISPNARFFYPASLHYGHTVVNHEGTKVALSDRDRKDGFRKARLKQRSLKKRVKPRPFMLRPFQERRSAIREGLGRRLAIRIEEEARYICGGDRMDSSAGYALGAGGAA